MIKLSQKYYAAQKFISHAGCMLYIELFGTVVWKISSQTEHQPSPQSVTDILTHTNLSTSCQGDVITGKKNLERTKTTKEEN